MVKKVKIVLLCVLTILMVGCGENKLVDQTEEIDLNIICPDGLPAIAISKVLDDNGSENIKINYSLQKTTDLLLSELMKAEADVAIVPSNLALQAYKKDLGYKVAGTIGWGSLYLVSTEEIDDISDLVGKEIYNTGQGLTPDIVFKNILANNNISEEQINFSYVGAASELAPMIISGKVKYAILPEPVLSTVKEKCENINIILSLNEEWIKGNDVKRGYPQSTLIIKDEVYNRIKEYGLYDEFIKLFTDGEAWILDNPQEASEICEKLGITVNKNILEDSLKNSNLEFTNISECMNEYEKYFMIIDSDNEGDINEYEEAFIKE